MVIRRADFVVSMQGYGDFATRGLPEVVFAGRSNVGKSSMINRLVMRKGLARTSQTPGRTRLINVFLLNESFNLIDLPGYGFAKVSRKERFAWGQMMEGYFSGTQCLRHVFHLVDIRHEPTQEDREMNAYLRSGGLPFTVVATKADKVSRGARLKCLAPICRALGVQPWQIIPFSSETGEGRDAVLDRLEEACSETGGEIL